VYFSLLLNSEGCNDPSPWTDALTVVKQLMRWIQICSCSVTAWLHSSFTSCLLQDLEGFLRLIPTNHH